MAICEHLRDLEQALLDAGFRETFRGQPWSKNCREWVYFDCILDLPSLRKRFSLSEVVQDHDHVGTHDGCERGFYCSECHDGIMGSHPSQGAGVRFG
jgi:hypothetical protein